MSGDRMTEPKLIWTRGGDGSHWDGCYDTHWDCAIAALRSFGEAHERRAALA